MGTEQLCLILMNIDKSKRVLCVNGNRIVKIIICNNNNNKLVIGLISICNQIARRVSKGLPYDGYALAHPTLMLFTM